MNMKTVGRAMAIGAVAAGAVVAPQAFAHSGLKSSTPAAGAKVKALPAFLKITFEEAVGRVTSVRLLNAANKDFVATAGLDPRNAARVLAKTTATAVPAGTYRVQWKVVASDGHSQAGTYTFRVVK